MYKSFSIEDHDLVCEYVAKSNYIEHNLSFTNMFLWRKMFKLSLYVSENFLIVFSEVDGEYFCLNPICDKKYIPDAIEFLVKHFKSINKPLIIHNCLKEVKEVIETHYGDKFEYIATRETFDYIYLTEKLMNLTGKKLQKKRNHVNSFIKEYENRYEYVSFENNPEIINDCLVFLNEWDLSKEAVERDIYLETEIDGAKDVLNNFKALKCRGGAIKIDGKVSAFSIGTYLNQGTGVINIEKAIPEIRGLYPMMRKLFVTNEMGCCKYINTEDDVGDEGLRKAKLSFYPEYLLEKYTIKER